MTAGPVEKDVRRSLELLKDEADESIYPALAAGAVVLARTLDAGAGLSTAAVHRELRATLLALTPREVAPDDELLALMNRIREATRRATK